MKKIGKTICALLAVMLLTGCMKFNIRVNVKSAEEVDYGIEYLVSQSMLESAGEDPDSYLKEMEESMKKEIGTTVDVQTKTIEKTIDNEKWIGFDIATTLKGEDAKKIVKEQEVSGKKQLVMDLTELIQYRDTSASEEYSPEDMGIEMNMVVTMPSTPTTTFGEVKGNDVHIDCIQLFSSDVKELKVTCDLPSSNSFPIIAVVVGAVLGVGAFMLVKKKKAKAEPMSTDANDNAESE